MNMYGFGINNLDAIGLACVDSKGYTRNIGCAGGGNVKVKPVCGNVSPEKTSTTVKYTRKCIANLNTIHLSLGLNNSTIKAIDPVCSGVSLGKLGLVNAATSNTLRCPSGQVIVGISGTAGFHISSLKIICDTKTFMVTEFVGEAEYVTEAEEVDVGYGSE